MDTGNTSGIGTNGNASLLQKFLNGDADLRSIEQRDLRVTMRADRPCRCCVFSLFQRLLSELEAKYKAAMIANSSMYNEKQALRYQVEAFKDMLDDHYETLNQAKRQLKDKSRVKTPLEGKIDRFVVVLSVGFRTTKASFKRCSTRKSAIKRNFSESRKIDSSEPRNAPSPFLCSTIDIEF